MRLGFKGQWALFLFVIFFVFLEFSFFVEKQFLDLSPLRRIASDLEQFPIVLDVLPNDKTLHHSLPKIAPFLVSP
jgi:hypothetical protein